MKYCSPRAIEPRIPSYTHTNSTLRAIVRIAKPIFVLNSAAISNATLKEIIVTEILKATRVILTSTTTQTTDIQAFHKLQNSNSVEILDQRWANFSKNVDCKTTPGAKDER